MKQRYISTPLHRLQTKPLQNCKSINTNSRTQNMASHKSQINPGNANCTSPLTTLLEFLRQVTPPSDYLSLVAEYVTKKPIRNPMNTNTRHEHDQSQTHGAKTASEFTVHTLHHYHEDIASASTPCTTPSTLAAGFSTTGTKFSFRAPTPSLSANTALATSFSRRLGSRGL